MKNKLRLDTMKDVTTFVNIISSLPYDIIVKVTDGKHFSVNGRSFMGVTYASAEFNQLYVEASADIYDKIDNFIEIES